MSTTFKTEWDLGDHVHVDGDTSIRGVIVGFWVGETARAQVQWFHNGDTKEGTFANYRLTKVEKH